MNIGSVNTINLMSPLPIDPLQNQTGIQILPARLSLETNKRSCQALHNIELN